MKDWEKEAWDLTKTLKGEKVTDSLSSSLLGLGMKQDRTKNLYNTLSKTINPSELFSLYRDFPFVRQAIDIPAEEATREWRKWNGESDRGVALIEEVEKKLQVKHKTLEAIKSSRLWGGSALLLYNDDEDLSKPMIANSSPIRSLELLTRFDFLNNFIDKRVQGNLDSFTITSQNFGVIHSDRLIFFKGKFLPYSNYQTGHLSSFYFWGDSYVQSIYEIVNGSRLILNAISQIVMEMKYNVFSIKDLENSASMNAQQVKRTLENISLQKSIVNDIVLDGNIDLQVKNSNLSGLPQLINTYMGFISSAVEIPQSRLFGMTLAGLSNTGEEETRKYYDRIANFQKNILEKSLEPLDTKLLFNLGLNKENYHYEWNTLWQETKAEKLQNQKTIIDGLVELKQADILTSSQVLEELNKRNILSIEKEDIQALEEIENMSLNEYD